METGRPGGWYYRRRERDDERDGKRPAVLGDVVLAWTAVCCELVFVDWAAPGYEGAFCIGGNALMKITLIWLFVPFADALWRGFASCKEREGDYSICLEAEEP